MSASISAPVRPIVRTSLRIATPSARSRSRECSTKMKVAVKAIEISSSTTASADDQPMLNTWKARRYSVTAISSVVLPGPPKVMS